MSDPGVIAFSRTLIRTRDLDPIYVMLVGADLPAWTLERWCLAYWLFYHAGVSSRIAEAEDFWATVREADREKWPRGTERRHFRGAASSGAIDVLADRFPDPEAAVRSIVRPTFRGVSEAVREWPMFGPWIAFKVADMLERVLGEPVDFSDCELAFYREPAAGASLVAAENGLPDDVPTVVGWLLDRLLGEKAPPNGDRRLNVQEAETCLCKYKSHRNGHYPVGKDSREVAHALTGWGPLADRLSAHVPG